ncbi:MAG: DNA/RNA nuclease SfsA [Janthinobacterium lividum]
MIQFTPSLLPGRFVRRYKRFFADIILDDGREIIAHCANSGAMLGLLIPGTPVWVSEVSEDSKRQLRYTWELVDIKGSIIGINTQMPNRLVEKALQHKRILELADYPIYRREVKYGTNSRIDFLLTNDQGNKCYLEVKQVHMRIGDIALFPDCVTTRGTKHLQELIKVCQEGMRAVMLYVLQRQDCKSFALAADIDPIYAKTAQQALKEGVEFLAYACALTPDGIEIVNPVEVSI